MDASELNSVIQDIGEMAAEAAIAKAMSGEKPTGGKVRVHVSLSPELARRLGIKQEFVFRARVPEGVCG